MAAITVVKARPCSPAGYEVVDKTTAALPLLVDVVAGDELTLGSTGWGLAPITGITEADGIALQPGYAGQVGFDVGIHGEMDGFSGLTPGAPLYPSVATAGKLNTTAIAGATVRVKAVRPTRIRYCYV